MSKLVLVNLNLNGNELQNAVIQPLAAAPESGKAGQIYFNTVDKLLYQYNGTSWNVVGPVTSVAGKTGDVTLVKADVGLGNVDNTSDAAKKTAFTGTIADGDSGFVTGDAVYDALALKLNLAGGTMSGNIAMGNNKVTGLAAPTVDGDAANKKYVDDAMPVASDDDPLMDGTADAGDDTKFARADHVHPTDTTRQAKITASGILKGDGNGGVTAAVADTDYGTYSKPTGGIPKADLAQTVQDSLDAADAALPKAGGTMSGNITMGSNKVTGLGAPSSDTDAATKKYVDDQISDLGVVLDFKGTVANEASLPLSNMKKGDVYIVTADNSEWVWTSDSATGTKSDYEKLGPTIDLSGYLEKSGGTMSGAIAMGNNKITGLADGTAATDAATYGQVSGLIKTATGTIGTSATSADVSYTGTLISARATVSGEEVGVDIAITSNKVTFSVAQAPTSAVTCTVIYA